MAEIDLVFPLKWETDEYGTENNPTEESLDPLEDYVSAKGFSFERSKNHYLELKDNEISFVDPINGQVKVSELGGGGLTETTHKNLDQLVHNIAENSYTEITRNGILVSSIIIWTDSNKTQKIREEEISYTGVFVNQVITKQYNSSGVLNETLTEVYSYNSSNNVTSIDTTMS